MVESMESGVEGGPANPETGGAEPLLRLLMLGDVVGRPGRRALAEALPRLRARYGLDMVIANGENAAGGIGLTPETARELLAAGVDVLTSGNHIWKHREIMPWLEDNPRVLRPANYGPGQAGTSPGRDAAGSGRPPVPGHGLYRRRLPCGTVVAVLNLLGRVFMEPADCPFAAAETALTGLFPAAGLQRGEEGTLAAVGGEDGKTILVVDFHAEATSEKRAMAHFLDGKAAVVCGTHTHVQTADARVSAAGTASLTDLGMCGVEEHSVLGMSVEPVVKKFRTGLPQPFRPASDRTGEAALNGALVEIGKNTGRALSIRLIRGTGAAL